MKIAVDARMIKMSGIGTYIQNLMKNGCYDIALGKKEEIETVKNDIQTIEFDAPIYGIKEQLKFPYKELKKQKPDVLHVPHYNVPIFYRGKMIVTIHDLTHLVLPEFLPNKFAYLYAKFMIWIALKKATKVITVSQNTKNDILKMFKVNSDKIEVIYNGVGEEFVKKEKQEIEYLYEKFNIPRNKKVIMYVGNLKPHKNLERLLEAYSKIENIDSTCLLLVGKAFTNYNVLEENEKLLNIDNNVIHTGIVSQEELVGLYNLADLFVFPSLYEGFGIPILEALACRTPVICSNNSSIPEVGGDLVEYFDAYNIEQIKKSIENKLFDNKKQLNEDKVQKRLKQFNWKNISIKTKEVLTKGKKNGKNK